MEERYIPERIHRNVWGKFFVHPGHETDPHDYQVRIEIKKSSDWYYIIAQKNEPPQLLKGPYDGISAGFIKDEMALFNDKDLLGKVEIRYKGKILSQHENYNNFYDFIKT